MATGQYTGVNGVARKVKKRYVGGGGAFKIYTKYGGYSFTDPDPDPGSGGNGYQGVVMIYITAV